MEVQTIASVSIGFAVSMVVLYYKFRSRRVRHPIPDENPEDHENLGDATSEHSELSINSRDVCSICLDNHRFKIETSCHHQFCANCFTSFWHMGNFVLHVHCPMCRTYVTKLTMLFNTDDDCNPNPEKTRLINEVRCFNRLYSIESKSWRELIFDIPVIVRHCVRQFLDVGSLSILHRIRIAVLVIILVDYCLTPFDVLPESGFGILGFIDDILIIATFLTYVAVFIRQTISGRAAAGLDIDDEY